MQVYVPQDLPPSILLEPCRLPNLPRPNLIERDLNSNAPNLVRGGQQLRETQEHYNLEPRAAHPRYNSAEYASSKNPKKRFARRERKRLGLPLSVITNSQVESVTACPDSGSDDNIISSELANRLGLLVTDTEQEIWPSFSLANGTRVSAIGRVTVTCGFERDPNYAVFDCVFYVFQKLAVPMIIGMEFLDSTETMTRNRNRLIEQIVPSMQALRVSSIGRPEKNIICQVDRRLGCATADTGSDLDLVKMQFAASRGFHVEEGSEQLDFADGSTGYTVGVITAAFFIGIVSGEDKYIPQST